MNNYEYFSGANVTIKLITTLGRMQELVIQFQILSNLYIAMKVYSLMLF